MISQGYRGAKKGDFYKTSYYITDLNTKDSLKLKAFIFMTRTEISAVLEKWVVLSITGRTKEILTSPFFICDPVIITVSEIIRCADTKWCFWSCLLQVRFEDCGKMHFSCLLHTTGASDYVWQKLLSKTQCLERVTPQPGPCRFLGDIAQLSKFPDPSVSLD